MVLGLGLGSLGPGSRVPERQLGKSRFEDQFADIKPYINGVSLTPKHAVKRIRGLLHLVKRLQLKLLKNLYMIKDYIVYHRMQKVQQNELASGSEEVASEDGAETEETQSFGSQSGTGSRSGSRGFKFKSDPFKTDFMKEQAGLNFGNYMSRPGDERVLWDGKTTESEPVPIDQPLLHSYGGLTDADRGFERITQPAAAGVNSGNRNLDAENVRKPLSDNLQPK